MTNTIEVRREGWEKLCDQVNALRDREMVNVEWTKPSGQQEMVATNSPLRSMSVDSKSNPCSDLLIIDLGTDAEKPLRHVVVEPIHIRLKKNGNGRYSRMEIVAETGTTSVEFHPGLNADIELTP